MRVENEDTAFISNESNITYMGPLPMTNIGLGKKKEADISQLKSGNNMINI